MSGPMGVAYTHSHADAVAAVSKFVEEKNCEHGCKKLDEISEEAEGAYDSNNCGTEGSGEDEGQE